MANLDQKWHKNEGFLIIFKGKGCDYIHNWILQYALTILWKFIKAKKKTKKRKENKTKKTKQNTPHHKNWKNHLKQVKKIMEEIVWIYWFNFKITLRLAQIMEVKVGKYQFISFVYLAIEPNASNLTAATIDHHILHMYFLIIIEFYQRFPVFSVKQGQTTKTKSKIVVAISHADKPLV